MATDIHALTEAFDVVDQVLTDAKKAKADGFPWTDIVLFTNLWTPVKKALSDVALVVPEAKGMDADDAAVVVTRAVKVAQEVMDIFAPAA